MKAIQNIWRKKEMAVIEVVAAVIYKENKFMIAQRNLKKSQGRTMGVSRWKNRAWRNSRGSVEEGNLRRVSCRD